ncbi:MAG: nuoJ [Paenibacillaceae bacterium]|jgi:NADH-quinone oxidoreductase subunit J|nr:nuoJ [Paenibacillaceae bacterium]
MLTSIVFYIFAAVIVASALAVVLMKNLVHAALYLVAAFVGVAAMYVLLEAEFLAVVQILVYAGAVAIIIAFGLMLTRRTTMSETSGFNTQKRWAAVTGAVLFGIIAFLFARTDWNVKEGASSTSVTEGISELMFVDYVIAFETIAILLLIAMVGAIVIAKEVKKRRDNA